jgi:hypothetical protein
VVSVQERLRLGVHKQRLKYQNSLVALRGLSRLEEQNGTSVVAKRARIIAQEFRKGNSLPQTGIYTLEEVQAHRARAISGLQLSELHLRDYLKYSLSTWSKERLRLILNSFDMKDGSMQFLRYFTQWIEQNDLKHLGDYLKANTLNLVSTTGPSLASAVYYLGTKKFVEIPETSKIYKNAISMAHGLSDSEVKNPCLILDEALLHQLETCDQLKQQVLDGKVKLLCLEGFVGVPNFSTNTEIHRMIGNLIEWKNKLKEDPNQSTLERCDEAYKAFLKNKVGDDLFKMLEFVRNKERLPSGQIPADLQSYYDTLFLTEERLQKGLDGAQKFFPTDVWKVLKRILLANSQIYSYRTLIPQLQTMHQKVLKYVVDKKLDVKNVYFCTVQNDFREKDSSKVKVKSDCLLAHLYAQANDIPIERFIADYTQIPVEQQTNAVIVFIDDFTASGQTPAVKIHDCRKQDFQGHIIIAQLYSNPWITNLMQKGNYFTAFQNDESFPERDKKLGTEPLTRDDNAGFIAVQEHPPLWLSGLTGNDEKKQHFQKLLKDGGLSEEQINQLSELLINFPEDEKRTILNKLNWFVSKWLQGGYALSNPYMCPDNNKPIISILLGLLGLKNLSSIKLDETLVLGKTLAVIADNPKELLQIGFQGLTSKMKEAKAPN